MKEEVKEGATPKARRRRAARFSSAAALAAVAVALAVLGATGAAAPGAPGAGGAILPDMMAQVQEQGEPSVDPEAADSGTPSGNAAVGDEASEPDADPQPAGQAASAGDLPDHEAGVVLAGLADGADLTAFVERACGLDCVAGVDNDPEAASAGFAVVRLAEGADEESAREEIGELPEVTSSEPDWIFYPDDDFSYELGQTSSGGSVLRSAISAVTNDPRLAEQWALESMNAFDAWSQVDAAKVKDWSVNVAVLDTGCNIKHEDLKSAVKATYDATGKLSSFGDVSERGHGTHVCGIIAAVGNNGKGIAGVGHNKVGVVPVNVHTKRADGSNGANTSDVVKALNWVAENSSKLKIKAVNMSFGHLGGDSRGELLGNALEKCYSCGVTCVAAAGNNGLPCYVTPSDYMVNGLSVIALANTGQGGVERAWYSNYNLPGSVVKNISAPGSSIVSCDFQGAKSYKTADGTSLAAPMVAAAAALVSAANPSLSVAQVREALLSTARDLGDAGFDENYGYGEVDLAGAVEAALDKSRWEQEDNKGLNALASATVRFIGTPVYTGDWVKPDTSVNIGSKTLVEGRDYRVDFYNNKAVGVASARVSGEGAYAGGVKTAYFDIHPASIGDVAALGGIDKRVEYNPFVALNSLQVPFVKHGEKLLQEDVDYKLEFSWSSDTVVKIKCTGMGNYTGTLEETFTATPFDITNFPDDFFDIEDEDDVTCYDVFPRLYLGANSAYDGINLEEWQDYRLTYANNAKPGIMKTTVHGVGHFTGTKELNTKLVCDMSDVSVSDIAPQVFTGSQIRPTDVKLAVGAYTLSPGVDYELRYEQNTKVGTGTVRFVGKGDYFCGETEADFAIVQKPLEGAVVTGLPTSRVYSGKAIEPSVTVKVGAKKLVRGVDYVLDFYGNVKAGTATMVIAGVGDYTGSISRNFKIVGGPASSGDLALATAKFNSVDTMSLDYRATELKPRMFVTMGGRHLIEGKDFRVSYHGNKDVGTAHAVVEGIGSYSGSIDKTFTIKPQSMSLIGNVSKWADDCDFGDVPDCGVSKWGNELERGIDYTATITGSPYPGTGYVRFTGYGNYTGSCTQYYKIQWYIDGLDVHQLSGLATANLTYTGTERKPVNGITMIGRRLQVNHDYTISYEDNVDAGMARVIITGKGRYAAEDAGDNVISFEFPIFKAPMSAVGVSGVKNFTYNFEDQEQDGLTVSFNRKKLVENEDYYASGSGTEVGSYEACIWMAEPDNFLDDGITSRTFRINPLALDSRVVVSGVPASQAYTGKAITFLPDSISVRFNDETLINGIDYKIAYRNNTKKGDASVVIKGIGNFKGSVTKPFKIV